MSKTFREILVDLVDEHFPKGKSKERGEALVLVAEALYHFLTLIPKEKKSKLNSSVEEWQRIGHNSCREKMLKNMGVSDDKEKDR